MDVSNYTYPLDFYEILFSPERWVEILKVLNNWIHPELSNGKVIEQLWYNPETGYLTWSTADVKGDLEKFKKEYGYGYNQKKVLVRYLKGEELEKVNSFGLDIFREHNQARAFEKGKKIPASEWGDPVFDKGGDFYTNVDQYIESREDEELEIEDWVYGSYPVDTLKHGDLDVAIDNILDQHSSGLEDPDWLDDVKIPETLKREWEKFCDENSQTYYWQDDETIILLK